MPLHVVQVRAEPTDVVRVDLVAGAPLPRCLRRVCDLGHQDVQLGLQVTEKDALTDPGATPLPPLTTDSGAGAVVRVGCHDEAVDSTGALAPDQQPRGPLIDLLDLAVDQDHVSPR